MTTAFITGITGCVGSHLADYLLANTDWSIVGMIRWRSPLHNIRKLLPLSNRGERVRFVYADLRDTMAVRDAVRDAKPDYVFHLAAQSFPQTSFGSPLDTMDTNAGGTVRLLDAIKEHAKDALVHVCSSSEVYGRVAPERLPIKEDCPFGPASPYAISKAATDMFAEHYFLAYGLNVIRTRMFTHTGPRRGDVFAESSFAKQIVMAEMRDLDPVVKVGNLKSLRTVADVRDAVRAYHMLMTANPRPGEVYNIGGTHTARVGEILDSLIALSNVRPSIEVDPARLRPIDADLQIPDCKKFTDHTGWAPQIPYTQTMGDLLDYWRSRLRQGPSLTR